MPLVITINDKKRLVSLVEDRIYLCGQVRDCNKCPIKEQCDQLAEEATNPQKLTLEKIDKFLEQFEKLRNGNENY